jgi:TolA-binding protein
MAQIFIFAVAFALAQGPAGPQNPLIRQGMQLDLQGKYADARQVFQQAIDNAPNPLAKSERAMAMSWALEANCKRRANTRTWSSITGDAGERRPLSPVLSGRRNGG